MRPIASRRNELRYPLDTLLGTEGQVRVLRVLIGSAEPLASKVIQEESGLSLPGTHKVIDHLYKTGFLLSTVSGNTKRWGIRRDDSLIGGLTRLFELEQAWFEDLIGSIRRVIANLEEPIVSAWLHKKDIQLGAPVNMVVLTDSRTVDQTRTSLRQAIQPVEQRFDITVEIEAGTRADKPEVDPDDTILLGGVPPQPLPKRHDRIISHADLDRRSAARASALARMVERDHSLARRALEYVGGLLNTEAGAHRTDLEEWRGILETYSTRRLVDFLKDDSARAIRLRQSSPFLPILTEKERTRLVVGEGPVDD